MSQRTIDKVTEVVTTSNATQTTLITYPIPSGASISAECTVVGRDTSNGDTITTAQKATAKNVSGTASLVGSVLNMVALTADTLLSTASVTMTISGTNLLVRVTGVLSKGIEWFGELKVWIN